MVLEIVVNVNVGISIHAFSNIASLWLFSSVAVLGLPVLNVFSNIAFFWEP